MERRNRHILRRAGAGAVDFTIELAGGLLGSYFGALLAAFATMLHPGVQPEAMQHSIWSGFGFGFAFWVLAISFLNRVLIQGISRASIGKKIFQLELVSTGEPLSWRQMSIRWALSLGSATALGAGYGYALFNDEGKTLHDLVAGTEVLKSRHPMATVIPFPAKDSAEASSPDETEDDHKKSA